MPKACLLVRFISGEPADQAEEVANPFRAAEAGKHRLAVLPTYFRGLPGGVRATPKYFSLR